MLIDKDEIAHRVDELSGQLEARKTEVQKHEIELKRLNNAMWSIQGGIIELRNMLTIGISDNSKKEGEQTYTIRQPKVKPVKEISK